MYLRALRKPLLWNWYEYGCYSWRQEACEEMACGRDVRVIACAQFWHEESYGHTMMILAREDAFQVISRVIPSSWYVRKSS